jgi:AcrR family transcriptional regulator
MRARADAVEATRERIARAALARFIADPYETVTITAVAKDAGVSHQTVLNHFASKEGLFTAATERFGADVMKLRGERDGHDAASAVALAIEQYEATGDGNVRLAMLDDRIPAVKAALDVARATHQAWLADVFADELPSDAAKRSHVLSQLHAATDVYTWKLLRRDFGLGRRATQKVMTDTVTAILDSTRREP